MRFPACGVRVETLLPKLPIEYFELLNEKIACSLEEAQLIYNKFRMLAPTGRLSLSNFQECLGLFGTIGRLLAERMFRAFDLNNDDYLDFLEFSSSLLIMIKGTEDKKLSLSYRIIHPNPQNLPNTIIGSLELSSIESKSPYISSAESAPRNRNGVKGKLSTLPKPTSKDSKSDSLINDIVIVTGKDPKSKDRSMSSSSLNFIKFTTKNFLTSTRILSSIADKASDKNSKSDDMVKEEEGIQFGEFVDFVNDIALTKALLVCREPNYYSNDQILKIFQRYASVSREGIKRLTQSDFVNAVVESSEFLEFLGISLSQYAMETVSSSYRGVNLFLQKINASTFSYINRTKVKRKNVYKWINDSEAKRGLSVHFAHERWNNVLNMMIGLSISARYVYSQPEREPNEYDYSLKLCFDITENLQGLNVSMYAINRDVSSYRFDTISEYYRFIERSSGKPEAEQTVKFEEKQSNQANSVDPENAMYIASNKQDSFDSNNSENIKSDADLLSAHEETNFEKEFRNISSSSLNIISNMSNSNLLSSDVDFRFNRFYKDNLHDLNGQPGYRLSNDIIKSRVLFREYAPMVFRQIRKISGISEKVYMESVSPEQIVGSMVLGNLSTMSELVSEGKSGALFYYTINGRLILKTVTKSCAKFVKRWVRSYYHHLEKSPKSILTRFYGLFSITNMPTTWSLNSITPNKNFKKTYFVVMNNIFYSRVSIHRRFDLKGSWVGRSLHPSELKDPTVALKDVDFDTTGEQLVLGPKTESFMTILRDDATFLKDSNLLDYSLLLGVHYRDQSRDKVNWDEEPEPKPGDQHRVMATDKSKIYYMGIVDLLTPWDFHKRMEHMWRMVQTRDHHGVSCVNPDFYCLRFLKFISDHLR